MLIAITRSPVSASISRTVRTVSYKIELPTFFDESVLVATCTPTLSSNAIRVEICTSLRQNIVHRLTRLLIALAEHTQQPQDLHLQEWVRNTGYIVFWAVSCGHERFQVADQ